MDSHCSNSRTGHHKFGAIHFIERDRRNYVRTCRYCTAVEVSRWNRETGRIVSDIAEPLTPHLTGQHDTASANPPSDQRIFESQPPADEQKP